MHVLIESISSTTKPVSPFLWKKNLICFLMRKYIMHIHCIIYICSSDIYIYIYIYIYYIYI